MQTNRNKLCDHSMIGKVLNFPATFVDWFLWRVCKVNHCMVRDDSIVFNKGIFTIFAIHSAEIKQWSVNPEMGFDIIMVYLVNAEMVTWVDKYNDLLNGLMIIAGDKKSKGAAGG
jgi:hypothetical protein